MILVNNRKLMDSRFDLFNIPKENRPAVSAWIDRRGKMTSETWEENAREIGLSPIQLASLKSMLDDKELWKQSEELIRFFSAIEALGLDEYIRFDPSIVRGLQYYTGTVFEAWEVGGEIKRSILGGGRYDNLLADVGGERLPAVGFAMGDVVITLLLQKYGLLPKDLRVQPASVLVTVFDRERLLASYRLAADLRRAGLNVAVYPEPAKLPKQFKYADKINAQIALVLGPDETLNNEVTIKNLVNGEQQTLARDTAATDIYKILESKSTK
jgi:histidyl-tRNA synthetase